MSSTRHASNGSPFRQERFASSQEYERGLMANLVAKRCSVSERAEDRELIWFLQKLSHEPGGMKKVATDVLARFPDRNATASMRKFGLKAGQTYNAERVRIVREEIENGSFPLKGEFDFDRSGVSALLDDNPEREARRREDARFYPSQYPAADFVKCCREAAAGLEKHLMSLCLDPAMPVADGAPWYFPTLISTLREFMATWIEAHEPAAVTAIGEKIFSALDYAKESRRMVLIDGLQRRGKSTAAKAWCSLNPGCARYIDCPAGNDDFTFFRDVALSLGVSVNLKSKAQELRNRSEEALRNGDLVLVIDQAHWLWPQSHYRNTTPARINWIMEMADRGVAIAMITTPQFFKSQRAIEDATCWTSGQFIGRIGYYEKLPDELSSEDLKAVASVMLPGAADDSIKALVAYAQSSGTYLGGMDAIAARACFNCKTDGRKMVEFRDVRRAIERNVTPSDEALKAAMDAPLRPPRRRVARVVAEPLQAPSRATETILPAQREMRPSRTEMELENA